MCGSRQKVLRGLPLIVLATLCAACAEGEGAVTPAPSSVGGEGDTFDASLDAAEDAAHASGVADALEVELGPDSALEVDAAAQPDQVEDTWVEEPSDAESASSDAESTSSDADTALPSYPELPEALHEAVLADMVAAKVPGLSACILKDEAIFWCGGFGLANLALDVPVTEHTPFLLASISKLFTSTVILQLVEAGEIDLDADVSEALGWDLVHPLSSTPITMRQLLTHHSGIKDNWGAMGDFYAYDSDPALSLQEVIEGYFQPEGAWYDASVNFATHAPTESFRYSNMAVALAAHIVERVSGQDFAERSKETLLSPLGLDQSAWRLSEFPSFDVLAMPYKWDQGGYSPTGHYTFADYPDGGMRASAYDLARFVLAHIKGGELEGARVLSQESVEAALSEQAMKPSGSLQGWMWYQLSFWGDSWWGHGGNESGVWTETFFRESDKMGFVTLANGDAKDANPIYNIQDALLTWAEDAD